MFTYRYITCIHVKYMHIQAHAYTCTYIYIYVLCDNWYILYIYI